MVPTRRLACALLLLVAAACGGSYEEEYDPPPPLPPRGEEVELRRLSSPALEISDPGVLVIRDSTAWRTLWTRYAKDPVDIPVVNFNDLMVVAVSRGGTSGCVNSAIYIERVEVGRDSLFVVLEPGSGGPEVTCAMVIAPVDIVAIPRSDLPVAFVGYPGRRGAPPPARWLARLTAEQTDTLAPEVRARYRVFLARDSGTSHAELVRLVERLAQDMNEPLFAALLDHPRVQADAALLQRMAGAGYPAERSAALLLERHGAALARDRGAPREALRLLLWQLERTEKGEESSRVARLLIRHPTVLGDSALAWDAYRYLLPRRHVTCAEAQRLWDRLHPVAPGGRRSAVCTPWDDSPMPADVIPAETVTPTRTPWPEQRGAPPRLRARSPEPGRPPPP